MSLADKIESWMVKEMEWVNHESATSLAEECAYTLNHSDWLDDPDHIVWEIAMEVFMAQPARDLRSIKPKK